MPRKFSFLTAPAILIFLLYGALVFIGFFIPLHTDEIGWQYANGRAIADHFQVMTLFPQCQAPAAYSKTLPWVWYPHALINHLLYFEAGNDLWFKIWGIFRCGAFFALLWLIVKPLAALQSLQSSLLFTITIAALSVDELPLLLQLNRPEQTLLLGASTFLALALNRQAIAQSKLLKYLSICVFFLTAALVFPSHPKAFALLPLALTCGVLFFKTVFQSRAWVFCGTAVLLAFASYSLFFWLERYSCPESALGQKIIDLNGLPLSKLGSHPGSFFLEALVAFFRGMFYDFNIHLHMIERPTDWLPLTLSETPDLLKIVQDAYIDTFSILRAGALIICIRRTIINILAWKKHAKDSETNFLYTISEALTVSLVTLMILSGHEREFYFVSLQVPLLTLTCLILFTIHSKSLAPYAKVFAFFITTVAVFNLALLVYKYYPYVTKPETRQVTEDDGRQTMFPAQHYTTREKAVLAAYNQCHLPIVSQAKHLITDDQTYSPLKNSFQPFSFDYINFIFFSGEQAYSNPSLSAFASKYESAGIVINCRAAPPALRPYLSEYHGYCCANAERLRALENSE